jgi:hypothetical protein
MSVSISPQVTGERRGTSSGKTAATDPAVDTSTNVLVKELPLRVVKN